MGEVSAVPPTGSWESGSPTLLVGSCEAFSGKSALVLGLARQLVQRRVTVRFGKPLAAGDGAAAQGSKIGRAHV